MPQLVAFFNNYEQDKFHDQLNWAWKKRNFNKPPDSSAYLKIKISFIIFQPKHVLGTQKNRLIETILLSTQNTCLSWWVRK